MHLFVGHAPASRLTELAHDPFVNVGVYDQWRNYVEASKEPGGKEMHGAPAHHF